MVSLQRDPNVRVKIPTYEKARLELGYEPERSLEEGLTKAIEWQKGLLKVCYTGPPSSQICYEVMLT